MYGVRALSSSSRSSSCLTRKSYIFLLGALCVSARVAHPFELSIPCSVAGETCGKKRNFVLITHAPDTESQSAETVETHRDRKKSSPCERQTDVQTVAANRATGAAAKRETGCGEVAAKTKEENEEQEIELKLNFTITAARQCCEYK